MKACWIGALALVSLYSCASKADEPCAAFDPAHPLQNTQCKIDSPSIDETKSMKGWIVYKWKEGLRKKTFYGLLRGFNRTYELKDFVQARSESFEEVEKKIEKLAKGEEIRWGSEGPALGATPIKVVAPSPAELKKLRDLAKAKGLKFYK